jgi:hypothetical protein
LLACGDAFLAADDAGPVTGAGATGGGTSSSGASGGSTSSAGGGGPCGSGLLVPDIPASWTPQYLIVAKNPGDGLMCPNGGDYPTEINFADPGGVCDCGCAVNAAACNANVESHTNASCTALTASTVIEAGCNDAGAVLAGGSVKFTGTSKNAGSICPVGNHTLPELQRESFLTCDVAPTGQCMEAPGAAFEQRVCIYQPGAHNCPADFPKGYRTFSDVDDQRVCSGCSCTDSSIACNGELGFHTATTCTALASEITETECQDLSAANALRMEYLPDPTGSCAQSGGAVTNAATPTGVETVCCTD